VPYGRWLLGAWEDERGFTLAEVMITIVVMGIVFAIASSTWFGVVEGRNVDSATNQLAAELRLAHTSASNQLTPWQVALTADSQSYDLVKLTSPAVTTSRSLPDDTEVGTSITIKFEPDGSAEVVTGSGNTIVVRSTDASPQQHNIEFNTVTSRIKIDP
jgi:prepilin-type N-terminal cleavage/methylation domain-containing protein